MNKKTDLSKFDSSNGLDREASKIKEILWYMFKILVFTNSIPFPSKLKKIILKKFGASVGKGLVIRPNVNINMPWKLRIGENVWIGEEVYIHSLERISIGNNVCISQGAMLLTGNHDYTKEDFPYRNSTITLKDGVWIGARSIVCPGVKCESHSILSVGSVATKELEPYTIYQGNPAKAIRKRVVKN